MTRTIPRCRSGAPVMWCVLVAVAIATPSAAAGSVGFGNGVAGSLASSNVNLARLHLMASTLKHACHFRRF